MCAECKLIEYNIPQLTYSMASTSTGERNMEIKSKVSIMTPMHEDEKPNIIEIKVNIVDDKEEINCSITIRGLFSIFSEKALNNDEKVNILKKNAFPKLYRILSSSIEKLCAITKFDCFSLPPIEEL